MAETPLNGDIEQQGELTLSSPAFEDGGRMPDFVGYINDDDSPELHIEGVPADAESLVPIIDDPEVKSVLVTSGITGLSGTSTPIPARFRAAGRPRPSKATTTSSSRDTAARRRQMTPTATGSNCSHSIANSTLLLQPEKTGWGRPLY